MNWEPVIGLEIHVQLATVSKLFSGAATAYGAAPNTQACIVDIGMPGVLPVVNREAVRMAVLFGLAIGADVCRHSVFARKNYFYPDLPKGYQISQYELPIVGRGAITIVLDDGREKRVQITRAHLEEDAGKSLHEDFHGMTGIDLNRAGTPLLEIVSEPDMNSAAEAVAYAKGIHTLVRYLGISDGNMQEGSFRCDANVSVRPVGETSLGTRTEIKNLNSFRFLQRAIGYEINRQIDCLRSNVPVAQETRLYDPDRNETRPMRQKEEANDYRYFPDPDLLPVILEPEYVENLRHSLPELPETRRRRYIERMQLNEQDALLLATNKDLGDYFEAAAAASGGESRLAANWTIVEIGGALNNTGMGIQHCPVTPARLGGLLKRIADGTVSGRSAKTIFDEMWISGRDADSIISAGGHQRITDAGELERLIDSIIESSPGQVKQYRAGKTKVLGFFVGQVMKETNGKADPKLINELLARKL
jgi:aspartyl-tRNA(Asn)/glutamyl-tRNA(Gln) amidotransferase subunit B